MKIIFVILIMIPLVISMPYLNNDGDEMFPANGKETLTYAKLTSDIDLAWEVQSNSLKLTFKLSSKYYWLVLGFHSMDNKEITSFDQAMFFRVREDSLSVKSADWSFDDGFLASIEPVWEKESESRLEGFYQVTVNRPIGDLEIRHPLKLVYGYGDDRRFRDINYVFKTSFKTKFIDLLKPGYFLGEKRLTTDTTVSTNSEKTNANATHMTQTKKPTEGTSTTTPETPALGKTTKESHPIIERLKNIRNMLVFQTTLSTPKHENETLITTNVKESVKRTSCPTTCNCTNHTRTQDIDSHWYDVIRTKENSTYFAIIGTAALLTALIVLLIACCCARSASEQPRRRKHKVTLYNVDDFDSADEEIDLMGNEKQA